VILLFQDAVELNLVFVFKKNIFQGRGIKRCGRKKSDGTDPTPKKPRKPRVLKRKAKQLKKEFCFHETPIHHEYVSTPIQMNDAIYFEDEAAEAAKTIKVRIFNNQDELIDTIKESVANNNSTPTQYNQGASIQTIHERPPCAIHSTNERSLLRKNARTKVTRNLQKLGVDLSQFLSPCDGSQSIILTAVDYFSRYFSFFSIFIFIIYPLCNDVYTSIMMPNSPIFAVLKQ
jgi:hypothetical protein